MALKVAVVQLNANEDKQRNIKKAVALIETAIRGGAKFVLLPETFNYRGRINSLRKLQEIAEPIPGPSINPLLVLAQEHGAYVLAGSILEKTSGRKAYNTSVLIAPTGRIQAKYRKRNLFTALIGKKPLKESLYFRAGEKNIVTSVRGFKLGLSICYDVRFPALYQEYGQRGAHVLCVPSSFTQKTGEAHWETLLRARAIENLCYVLAPNQTGKDGKGIATFGNSLIVDPWGKVIGRASATKEEIIYANIDHRAIRQATRILPSIRRS